MGHSYQIGYLEQAIVEEWDGQTVDIFLYDDEADDPGRDADLTAIDSEPSDGNYARYTFSGVTATAERSGPEVRVNFGEAEFDIQGTTGEVDSFGIVRGDGVFVGTGPLHERVNLADHEDSAWTVDVGVTRVPMY